MAKTKLNEPEIIGWGKTRIDAKAEFTVSFMREHVYKDSYDYSAELCKVDDRIHNGYKMKIEFEKSPVFDQVKRNVVSVLHTLSASIEEWEVFSDTVQQVGKVFAREERLGLALDDE